MPLQGKEKKDYQRKYMREYMRRKRVKTAPEVKTEAINSILKRAASLAFNSASKGELTYERDEY